MRDEEERSRLGVREILSEYRRNSKWFGHVKRMRGALDKKGVQVGSGWCEG